MSLKGVGDKDPYDSGTQPSSDIGNISKAETGKVARFTASVGEGASKILSKIKTAYSDNHSSSEPTNKEIYLILKAKFKEYTKGGGTGKTAKEASDASNVAKETLHVKAEKKPSYISNIPSNIMNALRSVGKSTPRESAKKDLETKRSDAKTSVDRALSSEVDEQKVEQHFNEVVDLLDKGDYKGASDKILELAEDTADKSSILSAPEISMFVNKMVENSSKDDASKEKFMGVMKNLFAFEADKYAKSPATFLRGNSITAKLMGSYSLNSIGTSLDGQIYNLVDKYTNTKLSENYQNAKDALQGSEDQKLSPEDQELFKSNLNGFISEITSSVVTKTNIPPDVQQLFTSLKDALGDKVKGEKKEEVLNQVVGQNFYLRTVCPKIERQIDEFYDKKYPKTEELEGSQKEPIKIPGKLILIAPLQTIVNKTTFGKEPHLAAFMENESGKEFKNDLRMKMINSIPLLD